jgi:enoyl-CoA hydratase/carnithine racemase
MDRFKNTKEGKMSQLFNFKTLSVSLSRNIRNCKLEILNNHPQFSAQKFVEELEQLLDWLSNKTEISSVLIQTSEGSLNLLNKSDIKYSEEITFVKYLERIQRLCWGQIVLPQTIVWNLRGECDYMMLEMVAGGDLITCHPSFMANIDILKKGITPGCGTTSLLSKKVGHNNLYAKVLMSSNLSAQILEQIGLISFIEYGNQLEKILKEISLQSPIARIQFKRAINDTYIKEMDDLMANELSFSRATLSIGDWMRWALEKEFANPREFAKILRSIPTQADVNAQMMEAN